MTLVEQHDPGAERQQLVERARDTIARGSRSFRFASRLFDRRTRERAWLLYSWCRACDDIADGQTLGHDAIGTADGPRAVAMLRERTAAALTGQRRGELAFDALALLASECPIPARFVEDHLAGFELDAAEWRPQSEEDLLLYCYRVAGAVGCLMAGVMGVDPKDEALLDRACDLGIAFQLANIARDIREDDAIGRCYLPADWLAEMGIAPGEIMAPANRDKLAVLARRLAALADRYQASARVGARRLPFRSRWSVLSAAGIYGAIAHKVARLGPAAFDRRVRIGKAGKLGHVAKALAIACLPGGNPRPRDGLWSRPRRVSRLAGQTPGEAGRHWPATPPSAAPAEAPRESRS